MASKMQKIMRAAWEFLENKHLQVFVLITGPILTYLNSAERKNQIKALKSKNEFLVKCNEVLKKTMCDLEQQQLYPEPDFAAGVSLDDGATPPPPPDVLSAADGAEKSD